MRIQIREYIEFIKSFTEAANIMSKNFFVANDRRRIRSNSVVASGAVSRLHPFGNKKPNTEQANKTFEEQMTQKNSVAAHFDRATGLGAYRRAHRTARHGRSDRASL